MFVVLGEITEFVLKAEKKRKIKILFIAPRRAISSKAAAWMLLTMQRECSCSLKRSMFLFGVTMNELPLFLLFQKHGNSTVSYEWHITFSLLQSPKWQHTAQFHVSDQASGCGSKRPNERETCSLWAVQRDAVKKNVNHVLTGRFDASGYNY